MRSKAHAHIKWFNLQGNSVSTCTGCLGAAAKSESCWHTVTPNLDPYTT